jgi:hypothetical protein
VAEANEPGSKHRGTHGWREWLSDVLAALKQVVLGWLTGKPIQDLVAADTAKNADTVAREVLDEMDATPRTDAPRSTPKRTMEDQTPAETQERPTERVPAERAWLDVAAATQFLEDMREGVAAQTDSSRRDMANLRQRERILFVGLFGGGILALLFASIGILLIYTGNTPVGVVSSAVAIFPGAGTLILSRLSKTLKEQRGNIASKEQENMRVLQAIQATLMIPGEEQRASAIARLAGQLTDRAIGSPESSGRDANP